MKPRPSSTSPAAVEHAWRLWLWLDAVLPNLPAFARASAGAHAVDAALALLDALTTASWAPRDSPEARAALTAANTRVAFLRLLLRGMRERAYLSTAQHEHVAALNERVGRMVGAWLRATKATQ